MPDTYTPLKVVLIVAFVLGVIACYIAVVVVFQDNVSGSNDVSKKAVRSAQNTDFPIPFNIDYHVYSFDPQSLTYKGTAIIYNTIENEFLTVVIDARTVDVTASPWAQVVQADSSVDQGTPSGSLLLYPFDEYTHSIFFTVWNGNDFFNDSLFVDFDLSFSADFYGFDITNITFQNGYDNCTYDAAQLINTSNCNCNITLGNSCTWGMVMTFNAVRRRSTVAFAIIVTVVTWLLVFALTSLTIDTWVRNREIIPALLGFCAACLFALPTIRNAQPNIPPAGVWIDFMGYFFQITLVGLDVVILTVLYISRWEDPKANKA